MHNFSSASVQDKVFQRILSLRSLRVYSDMATVVGIIAELADAVGLLKARGMKAEVKDGLVEELAQKISSCKDFDNKHALQLCNALEQSSLIDTHAAQLQDAIDARVAESFGAAGRKATASKVPQMLKNSLAYLTSQDWLRIEEPGLCNPNKVMQVIGNRYKRLGISSLDEQTGKYAIMIVLHQYCQVTKSWPSYHMIYNWLQTFKSQFEGAKLPYAAATVNTFPTDPGDLPSEVLRLAYEADDKPITKDLLNFHQLESHIPLRSNRALLVREQKAMSMENPMGSWSVQPVRRSAHGQMHQPHGMDIQPHAVARAHGMPGLHRPMMVGDAVACGGGHVAGVAYGSPSPRSQHACLQDNPQAHAHTCTQSLLVKHCPVQ